MCITETGIGTPHENMVDTGAPVEQIARSGEFFARHISRWIMERKVAAGTSEKFRGRSVDMRNPWTITYGT